MVILIKFQIKLCFLQIGIVKAGIMISSQTDGHPVKKALLLLMKAVQIEVNGHPNKTNCEVRAFESIKRIKTWLGHIFMVTLINRLYKYE